MTKIKWNANLLSDSKQEPQNKRWFSIFVRYFPHNVTTDCLFCVQVLKEVFTYVIHLTTLGAVSIRKTVLPGMAIPMLKIRRPNGRLIFNMEIAIRR